MRQQQVKEYQIGDPSSKVEYHQRRFAHIIWKQTTEIGVGIEKVSYFPATKEFIILLH